MKAHIERDWVTRRVKVWLFQPHGMGHGYDMIVGVDDDGQALLQTFNEGELAERPSFILPEQALKALVEAGSELMPPSVEMAHALKDTREVRDRLLSMVEVMFKPTAIPNMPTARRAE